MNAKSQIFTRSMLAEAISRDPSKKADFSMAWEASKNPDLPKKSATLNRRSSDKELDKVTESSFDFQKPSPESAATTIGPISTNLPTGTNDKPNFVDSSNELANNDQLGSYCNGFSTSTIVSNLIGSRDFSIPLAAENKKGPQVDGQKNMSLANDCSDEVSSDVQLEPLAPNRNLANNFHPVISELGSVPAEGFFANLKKTWTLRLIAWLSHLFLSLGFSRTSSQI